MSIISTAVIITPLAAFTPRARPTPDWADDLAQLAALWRWLDRRSWPDDGYRPPDPAYFMEHGYKWADAYAEMTAACPECEGGDVVMRQTGPRDEFGVIEADEFECEVCSGTGRRSA